MTPQNTSLSPKNQTNPNENNSFEKGGIPDALRRPAPRQGFKFEDLATSDTSFSTTGAHEDVSSKPRVRTIDAETGKPEKPLHFYSREIAGVLNSKQHDITAAVVLYSLSLWQGNKYKQTLIDNRRYSFRSLTQLHQADHPYFSKAAIHKALKRLEKALGNDFLIKRDKDKLHFSIGEGTMKKLKKRRSKNQGEIHNIMNSFYVEDAIKTGSVRSAVLLANLKYALSKFTDPKADGQGNRYAELSPKKLCPILNFSEDTISRALSEMCKKGLIVRYNKASSFYALGDGFVKPKTGKKTVKRKPAEVHSRAAEVHDSPAEVHSRPAEVHTKHDKKAMEALKNQGSRGGGEVTCINECVNESSNQCIKGRVTTSTAPPRCRPSLSSKGLINLQELADARLSQMRSSKESQKSHVWTCVSELPYDYIADKYELPYDFVSTDHRTFNAWVKEQVNELKVYFRTNVGKVDKDDLQKINQLFFDNPQVHAMDLIGLFQRMAGFPFVLGKTKKAIKKRFLTKIKTPKGLLRYLPQIVLQVHQEDDDIWDDEVAIANPFDSLNYAYLGKVPKSAIISLEG